MNRSVINIFLFCLLPIYAVLNFLTHSPLIGLLSVFIIVSFNLFIFWLYHKNKFLRYLSLIFKLLETAFSLLVLTTKGTFDVAYVFSNLESVPAIILDHHWIEIALFFGLIAILITLYSMTCRKAPRLSARWMTASFVLALVLLQLTDARYVLFARVIPLNTYKKINIDYPQVSQDQQIQIQKEENVILLHLESLNSRVVNGGAVIEGKEYSKPMAPTFLEFAKKGIYFPEHYSNSVLTIYSEENTLCGITDNLDEFYGRREGDYSFKCLPRIFAENDFKTYFFKGDDIYFHDTKTFMQRIGFDVIYNREMMKEGDKEYKWGFQDDIFYQSIFEYIQKESSQKKFIYIAVSALNHYPFREKVELEHLKVYEEPETFIENYSNGVARQDFMLKTFIKHYESQMAENTHLFIFGDTSYPVGVNKNMWNHRNAYDDNFLTSMLYIPPKKFRRSYREVTNRYDHVSIFHTVLELLSKDYKTDKSIPEIVSNGINRTPRIIRLNQPYSDKLIALVGYPKKWIYNYTNRMVTEFDLEVDPLEQNPHIVSTSSSLDNFVDYVLSGRKEHLLESYENEYQFPIHIGDNASSDEWSENWRDESVSLFPLAEDFKYHFELSEIPGHLKMTLKIFGVEFHHRIFVNGMDSGKTICLTQEETEDCVLEFDASLLKEGLNSMVILNEAATETLRRRGKDDYIVYDVKIN